MDDDRSAVLVVRVWSEDGAGTLRGRLTSGSTSPGSPAPGTSVAVAGSPEDVVDAVRAWLAGFLRDHPRAVDP